MADHGNALLRERLIQKPYDNRQILPLVVCRKNDRVFVCVSGVETALHRAGGRALVRVHASIEATCARAPKTRTAARRVAPTPALPPTAIIMLENPQAVQALQSLLRESLRISIADGRIFIGTFVGTDKAMNILLVNTDEFRVGPNENPDGLFVGQILVPWRLVQKIEMQSEADSTNEEGSQDDDAVGLGSYI